MIEASAQPLVAKKLRDSKLGSRNSDCTSVHRSATASSAHPDAPAHRRCCAAPARTRGHTGASRWAGRFCCRSPGGRRARVCGRGGRAGIPGRAFRRDGVCGLLSQRCDPWLPPDLESELRSPRTPQVGRRGRIRDRTAADRRRRRLQMTSLIAIQPIDHRTKPATAPRSAPVMR
jgi:hypothetical protein